MSKAKNDQTSFFTYITAVLMLFFLLGPVSNGHCQTAGCGWQRTEISPHLGTGTTFDGSNRLATSYPHAGYTGCQQQVFNTSHTWTSPPAFLTPGEQLEFTVSASWSLDGSPSCSSLTSGVSTSITAGSITIKAGNSHVIVATNPTGSVSNSGNWTVPAGSREGATMNITARGSSGTGGTVYYKYKYTCSASGAQNHLPSVSLSFSPASPVAGKVLVFTATATDPDGDQLSYHWYLDGAGQEAAGGENFTWTTPTLGFHSVKVVVVDSQGGQTQKTTTFTVSEADRYVIAPGFNEGNQEEAWGFVEQIFLDGQEVENVENTMLYNGSRVKTGPGVEIVLRAKTGALFRVRENSILETEERTISHASSKVVFTRLIKGICNFYWPKGTSNATKLEVSTSRAVVGIKGTTFSVANVDNITKVTVQEGEVTVTDQFTGRVHSVGTGDTLTLGNGCLAIADDLSLELPCVEYQDTPCCSCRLRFFQHPKDPSGLYWKLEPNSVASAAERDFCVTLEDDLSLHIPHAAYASYMLGFTLSYYVNPDDSQGIYWKLEPQNLHLLDAAANSVPIIFSRVADTYVYGAHAEEAGHNYGAAERLSAYPTSNCNDANGIAYLKFDLTGSPQNVEQVNLVLEHLPHTGVCYSNCSADFYFYPVLTPWREMEVTYNQRPALGNTPIYGPVKISFPNELGQQKYDITDVYRQWKSGSLANFGLAIYSPTVGCNNAAVNFSFYSRESSDHSGPYLEIIAR